MFVEVIGTRPLPDDVDRDDVEDLLTDALGPDGEVTGAGSGAGSGAGRWNLDVEVSGPFFAALTRMAVALVAHDLGWVLLRPESQRVGFSAADLRP